MGVFLSLLGSAVTFFSWSILSPPDSSELHDELSPAFFHRVANFFEVTKIELMSCLFYAILVLSFCIILMLVMLCFKAIHLYCFGSLLFGGRDGPESKEILEQLIQMNKVLKENNTSLETIANSPQRFDLQKRPRGRPPNTTKAQSVHTKTSGEEIDDCSIAQNDESIALNLNLTHSGSYSSIEI